MKIISLLLIIIFIGHQGYCSDAIFNDSIALSHIIESYRMKHNINYTDSCILSLYDYYNNNNLKDTKAYEDFLVFSSDYFMQTNSLKEAETFNDLYLYFIEQNKKVISIDYGMALYQRSQISYSMSKWEDAISFGEMSLKVAKQIQPTPEVLIKQITQSLFLYKYTIDIEGIDIPYNNSELTIDGCIAKFSLQPDSIIHQIMIDSLSNLEENISSFNEYQYIKIFKSLANFYLANNWLIPMDNLLSHVYNTYDKKNIVSSYLNVIDLYYGKLLTCIGKYDDAIIMLNKSKNLYEKWDILNTDYIALLETLSQCYYFKRDTPKAKDIIDIAWNILNEKLKYSINSSILDDVLSIKALIYSDESPKMQDEAYKLYLEIYQRNKDKPNKFQLYNVSLTGLLYISLKRQDYRAAQLYKEEIEKDRRFPANVRFAFIEEIDKYKWQQNDSSLVTNVIERDNFQKQEALNSLSYYSELERSEMFNNTASQLSLDMYLLDKYGDNPDVCSSCYNNVLFYKNIYLSSDKIIRDEVFKSNNRDLTILQNEIDALKRKIIYEGFINEKEISNWVYDLTSKQRLLVSEIPVNDIIKQYLNTWETVRDALTPDEVAIEVVNILPIEKWGKTSGVYAALLIHKESLAPECVILGNMEDYCYEEARALSCDPILINELYSQTNNLYHGLWKKIETKLYGKTRIYMSLCDALGQINFKFIKNEYGQMLSDKYELFLLTTTNELCNRNKKEIKYNSAVIYGGIAFDSSEKSLIEESSKYEKLPNIEYLNVRDIIERGKLCQLNSSSDEVDSIFSFMKQTYSDVKIKKNVNANEESFKALNGRSPSIIHFATHGFNLANSFDPRMVKNNSFSSNLISYNKYASSMLSTGLMMAGANRVWNGEPPIPNVEDGILTSEEISALNLSKTDIVSLAACKTGTGDYSSLYGIVGLPRAFKLAGVKTIIVSLWNVDDAATTLMMVTFYKELLNTGSKYEAFKKAQQYVRSKYPDPYYWASFIMLD